MDMRRDYLSGSSPCPLHMPGVLRCRTWHPSRWNGPCKAQIVVTLCYAGWRAIKQGATFQRTKAVVGSEALLKLSCAHRCCHRGLFYATRACQKENGKRSTPRNGRECPIFLARRSCLPAVRVTNELTLLFNARFFLLRVAFGTTISRTRARVHCARCWTSGSQRLRMVILQLLSRAHVQRTCWRSHPD
jgi:hypothetical protein